MMSFFDVPIGPSLEHIKPFLDMKELRSSYSLHSKIKTDAEYMKHITQQANRELTYISLSDIENLNEVIKKSKGTYVFLTTFVKDNKVYYKLHINNHIQLLVNDSNMLTENDYIMTHTHCILSDIDLSKKIVLKVFDKLRTNFQHLNIRIVTSNENNIINRIIISQKNK